MEMTIKAEQARSMTNTALAKDNKITKEAEEFIRKRVQGKISSMARSGANHCLVPYFHYEAEIYKCVKSILEDNGYTVEHVRGQAPARGQDLTLPALLVRW